jgi:hypothetical protein
MSDKPQFNLSYVRSPHSLEKKILSCKNNVQVNTMVAAKRYHGSTIAKVNASCKDGLASANVKFRSSLPYTRTREGNQYGELSPDVVRDPIPVERPKPKNPSLHKGRTWGQAAKSVIIERK